MDYAHRRRVKIWGEARVVEDDEALTTSLMPKGYRARPEQVILFKIAAWDTNCPQHIPQKFDAPDVAAALAARDARIAELEAEVAALKGEKRVCLQAKARAACTVYPLPLRERVARRVATRRVRGFSPPAMVPRLHWRRETPHPGAIAADAKHRRS